MQESTKDSAIRLFGQKISLWTTDYEVPTTSSGDDLDKERPCRGEEEEDDKEKTDKGASEEETATQEDNAATETSAEETNDEESGESKTGETEKETLKKPDKILPCPRCNSMDTKFCYYNNYNVHQPRHFCKACQRYWTAGGTMRNVPVGAGRRKNKNSLSHYRHISISEALQAAATIETSNHLAAASKTNGKVLSFGFDAPNGKGIPGLSRRTGGENGDNNSSSASSITVSNSVDGGGKNCTMMNGNGFPSPIPCLPNMTWSSSYQWNSGGGFPTTPFYPAYWNSWNVPLLSPQSSTSSNQKAHPFGLNSPKRCREEDDVKGEEPKQKIGCVLIPKTLRFDDPSEAAMSSIWETLGIQKESPSSRGAGFKAFQSKGDEKSHVAGSSPVLRANPAALSRSINFHESS